MNLKLIVSGGQAGADRAGLDFAIAHRIPHIGFCPRGRRAEDGPVPSRYSLVETDSAEYPVRTELNVLAAEATVIFYRPPLKGGSRLTYQLCRKHGRPVLPVACPAEIEEASTTLDNWLLARDAQTLNIAGARLSRCPEIHQFVLDVLENVWQRHQNK